MTLVNKPAENLYDGIANMMAGAKDDYIKMSTWIALLQIIIGLI